VTDSTTGATDGAVLLTGDDGSGTSTITSTNEYLVVPDHIMGAGFCAIEFTGNGTGSNTATWGAETGSGDDTVGATGGAIISAGGDAIDIIISDSNATVGMYGVVFDGINNTTHTQTNSEIIGCTFVNCGQIDHSVTAGATFRDSTVTDSTTGATDGAVLLTGDPSTTADFRDMLIQNCNKGIEIAVAGTYSMRNISYAGNTHDLLTSHSTGEVTYDQLEGGDTPSNNNINGGTVAINNPVEITAVITSASTGNAIQNVKVYIDETPVTAPSLDEGLTDSNGEFTTSQNLTLPDEISVTARLRGLLGS
jgi:hypothetical protein